jgi:hypothetical protein
MGVERDDDLATGLESLIAEVGWCLHPSSVTNGIKGCNGSVSIGGLLLNGTHGWGREGRSCLRHD